ncbi:MAG: signal recognition particle-docking protein FtsY [Thermovirgaceae bacterium]|nr:signal recognition particle-docking protein FtsY [Thermovirgaceae bacterium]
MFSNIDASLEPVRRKWNLFRLFSGEVPTESFWDSLEETLISGDAGIELTGEIIRNLREKSGFFRAMNRENGLSLLAGVLYEHLAAVKGTGEPVRFGQAPTVVLLLGVNGSGKTTTAAKMAWNLQKEGKKVILAAADTFRAAAADQLKAWGERSGTRVVTHAPGGDPGAVVFDAIQAAKAGGHDCLVIDTAGRLHTKANLMEELIKMTRIIERNCPEWIVESLLVIDAVTGQNGFRQAQAFGNAIPLTGAVISKYDHTAKGGIILSVGRELGLPVRYVGLGEGIEDLKLFEPEEFVDALLGRDPGSV